MPIDSKCACMVHFQVLIDLPWVEITQIRADDYKDWYNGLRHQIK